jgi:two-component system response regulator CpxR
MNRRPIPALLLIDDDPGTARLLEEVFHEDGYEVAIAASGSQGLLLAEGRKFDAVLCDVLLPDIDGVEVLRRLRDDPVFARQFHQTAKIALTW